MPTALSWPILPDPATPQVPVTVVTRSETGRAIDTSGVVGRGLLRPFRRDGKQDFASGTGVELIAAHVGQILGTIASGETTGGELPWRTEFGSLLHLLRLSNASPAVVEKARTFIVSALRRWEPRVRVTAVKAEQTEGRVILRIRWRLATDVADDTRVVIAGLETEVAVG